MLKLDQSPAVFKAVPLPPRLFDQVIMLMPKSSSELPAIRRLSESVTKESAVVGAVMLTEGGLSIGVGEGVVAPPSPKDTGLPHTRRSVLINNE